MKRIISAVAVLSCLAFTACSSTQQAGINTTLANLNQTNLLALQTISNGCKIVQPTLLAAGAASPQVAAAATVNSVVCATADVATNAASAAVAAQAASAAPAPVASVAPVAAPAAAAK
jgi:hypothetical protein